MLKKIICALLAAAVMVSATACQGVSEEQKAGQTPEQKGGFIENEVILNSSEEIILLSQGNVKSIIVNSDGTVNCLCMYDLASDEEGIKQSVFAINGNEGEPLCKDFGAKFGESYNLLNVDEGYAYAETYQSKSASFTESTIMMASITDDNSEAVRLSILDALPQNVEKKVFQLQALPQNRYIVAVLNSESRPEKLNYFVIDAASNESYELLSDIEVSAGLTMRYISETDELAIRRQKDGKGSVGVFSLGERKMLSEETTFSYEGGYSILAGADAEAIYFVDGGGINRVTRGGTIVERIMEAKRYELNSPQWTPLDAVRTPEGEFYVSMFNITSANGKLMHYSYDPDIVLPEQTEFSIVASSNTPELRAAVDVFRQEHRDVAVEVIFFDDSASGAYQVHEGSGLTYEELLALQAEILSAVKTEVSAGGGADLLFLDANDMKEFVDAGYLLDLSETVPRGEMPAAIYETFKNESGITAIPVSLSVPCLYGMKENIGGVNTIDDIFAKADELGLYAFQCETIPQAFDYFIYTSYNSIIGMGELNEENFKKFLVYVDELLKRYSYSEFAEEAKLLGNEHPNYWLSSCLSAYRGSNPRAAFGMDPDYGVAGLNELFNVMYTESGNSVFSGAWFKPMPGLDEGAFLPRMCAGINANSENAELAAEFLNLLVSKEIQLGDEDNIDHNGYHISILPSVTQKFGDALVERVWAEYMTEEEKGIRFDFVELTNSLKTPEIIDDETLLILCDATEKYCAGEMTADEATAYVKTRLS